MKYCLLLLSFCLLAINGFAAKTTLPDDSKSPNLEAEAKKKSEKLALKLMLNAKQKDEAYKVCLKALQQKQAAIDLKTKNKTEYEAKMKKVGDEAYTQLVAILTPAQKAKMEKLKAEEEDKYKSRGQVEVAEAETWFDKI